MFTFMQIKYANNHDEKIWQEFVKINSAGSFSQAWEWGAFVEKNNDRIWRIMVWDEEELLAVVLIYKSRLKIKQNMLYAPRGPVLKDNLDSQKTNEVWRVLLEEFDKLARQNGSMVLQFDPPETDRQKYVLPLLDRAGYVKSEMDVQPGHTLILDIRRDEEELLKQMHSKTRYNIRLAGKKGVSVKVDNSAYKEFHELMKKTNSRHEISSFAASYYKKLLKIPFVKLYLAEADGRIVAANIMIFWNHTAVYLFGASDYEYRSLMAPYLLQWQAIKDAKKENIWFYDFWGAAPKDAKGRETKWSGFTRFKMGFSPQAEITEYLGTYEKAYSPVKLGVYRFLQKVYKR